jgi:site-specific DNA-methyltransferase (adenine-specific)
MTHQRNDNRIVDKDEARTPPSLFKKLNERFHFKLDAFCTESNCLCENGLFKEQYDALNMQWDSFLVNKFGYRAYSIYGNPPYSHPEPFIIKAYEESQKGATVVLLLPSDTSTKAFHKYVMKATEIIFIEGRVTFNNPDGTPMRSSPKFGSMVVVFKPGEHILIVGSMRWKE